MGSPHQMMRPRSHHHFHARLICDAHRNRITPPQLKRRSYVALLMIYVANKIAASFNPAILGWGRPFQVPPPQKKFVNVPLFPCQNMFPIFTKLLCLNDPVPTAKQGTGIIRVGQRENYNIECGL